MGGRELFRNITAALKVFDPGRVILADAGFGHGALQTAQRLNIAGSVPRAETMLMICAQGWAAT